MQLSIVLLCSCFVTCTHSLKDGEVEYGQESFEFQDGRRITCKTIYATDDRVSDGTQTSQLLIDTQRGINSVPIDIFPQSIPITIIDDDGEYIVATQTLSALPNPQSST